MIPLADAAQLLRLPYQNAHRLVLIGTLAGEKLGGRWFVQKTDVMRLADRVGQAIDHKQGRGR